MAGSRIAIARVLLENQEKKQVYWASSFDTMSLLWQQSRMNLWEIKLALLRQTILVK